MKMPMPLWLLWLLPGVAALTVGFAGPAAAQEAAADAPAAVVADRGAIPVSLDRIKQRMATLAELDDTQTLRLSERVDVYARALAIPVLDDFNAEIGPISFGPPVRSELLSVMTSDKWRHMDREVGGITVGW